MNPDVQTNGTNRAEIITFEAMENSAIFLESALRLDPFAEDADTEKDILNMFSTLLNVGCES